MLNEANIYLKNTKEFIEVCKTETGFTKEMFDQFEHFGELLADKKATCFIYCMAAKPGCFTKDDTINYDIVQAKLEITDKNIMEEIKSRCKFSKDEKDKCVVARDVLMCIFGVIGFHQK